MKDDYRSSLGPEPRKADRVTLDAQVVVRRAGFPKFEVKIRDLSAEGCKIEFVDRPADGERVWVKFDGLASLEATVCWIDGAFAGARFDRPLHPAVFDLLLNGLR